MTTQTLSRRFLIACKGVFLALGIIVSAQPAAAQRVLIDERPAEESDPDQDGFGHGLGAVFGGHSLFGEANDRLDIEPFQSAGFMLGLAYRYQPGQVFSLWARLLYNLDNYRVADRDSVPPFASGLPGVGYENERIRYQWLQLELTGRFHLSKRGLKQGVFLEAGGYAGYAIGRQWRYNETYAGASEEAEVRVRQYKGLEQLQYGVTGGIGYNSFGLYVRHRLSDQFTDASGFGEAELPRFAVGLKLEI